MKKKYILLVPVGGLANRMKAIDSAIKLSQKQIASYILFGSKTED